MREPVKVESVERRNKGKHELKRLHKATKMRLGGKGQFIEK